MQQPPPGYGPPPGYVPPGYTPPPKGNSIVKPLLIGCGALFVLLLIVGGVATWFTVHAVGAALHGSDHAMSVAQNAAAGVEKAAQDAGASPDPEHAAAAGVAALKALVGGGKGRVEPLSRDDLKAVLPASLGSLARTNAESSKNAFSGISGTSASAVYGNSGAGTVTIQLVDAANMTGLTTVMGFAMNAVTSEDDSGYEKNVQLGDVNVHEKWVAAQKHTELLGLVGDRFVISVDSDGLDATSAEQAFQAVDIAKLTSIAASTPK